ncbi:MAG: phosphoribosylanthranilate isomerase [Roseivirga sp.]|nr:phosphoribosylanthranilate isomerase [Roseivirga sp.]
MALKTFVKVSGVNNLSDARYCSGMEVDQLGFSIQENGANYTDPEKFKEIKGWLSGVAYVGEIEADSTKNISETVKDYELDALQVATSQQVMDAQATGLPIILKTDVSMITFEVLASLKDKVSYFLIESVYEGQVSPDILALTSLYPIVLGYGFDAETVEGMVSSGIKGIALKGGEEISPGLRDFDEMMDILEALEIDDTL